MSLVLNEKFVRRFITPADMTQIAPETVSAYRTLTSGTGEGADFLGWLHLPINYDKEEFVRIQEAAKRIRSSCDVFVVLGIGGSYLGARAAIEFLQTAESAKNAPTILFGGNTISAAALNDLIARCEGKDICVNVISKSGTTTETAVAFRVFRDMMVRRYGEEGAKARIFATTDKAKGTLKAYADKCGYETFVVPDDVGGRFSVLTAVGLLPIAVAGIDIEELMRGAAEAHDTLLNDDFASNPALRYAAIRNLLYRSGKKTEILAGYEPYQLLMNEWWKQLFGESEGKDGKGIFPASVIFSTDLHSLGQYIQQGERTIFETVLQIEDSHSPFIIPNDPENTDGLNFLSGRELDEVNRKAMLATLIAHTDGGVPNICLTLRDRSASSLGYLFYFFELACAVSGYILGVNPFNQPGVESYKKNMFALLGKPGYEELRRILEPMINE